jgi:hypothetical protein
MSDHDPERQRLQLDSQRKANWKRWGPYLAERQWGTVREDYSADGNCWGYFPHDHARSRAYRWGEDGILGITDRECRLCFALTMWNERDPILKESLFGLTNPEGNHGEDVKEYYFYLDSTPTHSYMKGLYKYPQAEFPYGQLVQENGRRGKHDPEYELLDTGLFDENRCFDIQAEYAKADPDDILIRITITNRGPQTAPLHFLPTLWFKNSWTWGCTHEGCEPKSRLWREGEGKVVAEHPTLGKFEWEIETTGLGIRDSGSGKKTGSSNANPELLFTENESNNQLLFNSSNASPYVKDAIHRYIINDQADAVNPKQEGTKVAAWFKMDLKAGESRVLRLRLRQAAENLPPAFDRQFDQIFEKRIEEAHAFYQPLLGHLPAHQNKVCRQAYAGLLWSKQFYHYVVMDWLRGDPNEPPPPPGHRQGRNHDWGHLFSRDVLSMPDKWEYPWFAAWDLAFHTIALAEIDPGLAKRQLILMLREWYMHPNGELPAYEFNFSDVNPPVHAWACWRVYKMTGQRGKRDRLFLARAFQKLIMTFTWWVNRKDPTGRHIFAGGFLGLDNIGVFDRSKPLPNGATLSQADGTAWMAFFCGTMLSIALELASEDPAYEDVASKFFEHFVAITDAINTLGGTGLWDETDGFYYDQMRADNKVIPLRIRSLVGIIPLFAVEILDKSEIEGLAGFTKRMNWFLKHRQDLSRHISYMEEKSNGERKYLLAIPSRERLQRMLQYVLSEDEFLSDHGVRSLSRIHREHPFEFEAGGRTYCVDYEPAESQSGMFGGNSNWRGPVWLPVNYLLIESLERYHHFYGDDFQVECPTGSGKQMNLRQVAAELSRRVAGIFLDRDDDNLPPWAGGRKTLGQPHWRDLIMFHEYFDGDTARGLGASHQTGWTALVAKLMRETARELKEPRVK